MFKRKKGFVLLALIVAFLFVLGCAGSSKEKSYNEC